MRGQREDLRNWVKEGRDAPGGGEMSNFETIGVLWTDQRFGRNHGRIAMAISC